MLVCCGIFRRLCLLWDFQRGGRFRFRSPQCRLVDFPVQMPCFVLGKSVLSPVSDGEQGISAGLDTGNVVSDFLSLYFGMLFDSGLSGAGHAAFDDTGDVLFLCAGDFCCHCHGAYGSVWNVDDDIVALRHREQHRFDGRSLDAVFRFCSGKNKMEDSGGQSIGNSHACAAALLCPGRDSQCTESKGL